MKETDLLISHRDGIYSAKVTGRANFEYAVPLRELVRSLDTFKSFRIDLGGCLAMDSTFMGVLTMLGLKSHRIGAEIELYNASDTLKKLLRDLGVIKIFTFVEGTDPGAPSTWQVANAEQKNLLVTAETVTEAHQSLVEADSANATRFDQVIEFAKQDVERLKGQDCE